jgi:hypothetical protein
MPRAPKRLLLTLMGAGVVWLALAVLCFVASPHPAPSPLATVAGIAMAATSLGLITLVIVVRLPGVPGLVAAVIRAMGLAVLAYDAETYAFPKLPLRYLSLGLGLLLILTGTALTGSWPPREPAARQPQP